MKTHFVLYILLLFSSLFSLAVAREQSATIYFETKTPRGYQLLESKKDQIKEQLLKDERFVDAKTLDPLWDQRPKIAGWLMFGSRGKAFDGIGVAYEVGGGTVWIHINCKARDVESSRVQEIRALVTAAIGEEQMKEITVRIGYENMFNTRP